MIEVCYGFTQLVLLEPLDSYLETQHMAMGQKDDTLGDHRFWSIFPFTKRVF